LANFKETSNAKKGGLFVGKSHAEGGIPAIVTDTGQPIEVEGGEAIINKKATALHWEELSKINQSAGNGVPIPPPDDADKVLEKYNQGGKITNKEKKIVFDKWKKLVNMTYTEISRYYHSKEGKDSGLTEKEANDQGISSGRESAEWILKMKKTNWKNWSDDMWKWANKQISFISRMSGINGDLIDSKGKKTRKYKALLIWGNNPKKKNAVQFNTGGKTIPESCVDFIKKSEAIKNNGYYLDLKNLSIYVGAGDQVPKIKSIFLITYNSGGQKNLKAIDTINSMELANKLSNLLNCEIGIARIIVSEQARYSKRFDMDLINSISNKNIVIADRDNIVCTNIISDITFNTGGLTSPEDAIRGLKAMLSFAEADEKAEILEQIKLLSNPTPELDPEDDYDEDDYDEDEEDDMSEVDKSITNLTNNYIQEIDTILGVSELDGKRKALLKWIKDPQQNVKVIIAFSGGKDSVAMVLRCIHEFKIPTSQIELWHHEVDGDGENLFDWKCTPSYCKAFADAMGVPILFSYSGGGILREMYRTNEYRQPMYFQNVENGDYIRTEPRKLAKDINTKRKFPAVANDLLTRWCSSVAKIEVMSKAINRLPRFKNQNFVVMTGERRAESKNRSKYHEIEKYKAKTKPKKSSRQALTWRCVIDMTDAEVWDMYRKYKIQPHPCYELGWGRCSCQLCIFGQKDVWASINEISPEKVQKIIDIEKELDHTLYNEFEKIPFNPPQYIKSGVNAGEEKFQNGDKAKNVYEAKVVRGKSFIPKEALARWGKEALGEFVSPIFVKEFKMPFGANSKEQMGAN